MGWEQGIVTTRKPRPATATQSIRFTHICRQSANEPARARASQPRRVESQAARRYPSTIAAIFTHMHNVRCKWIRLTAPHLKVPAQLNRATCTPQQATIALAESAACCTEMLDQALDIGAPPHRNIPQRCLGQALAGWNGNATPT